MAHNGIVHVPVPRNEPVLGFVPGSPERRALRAETQRLASREIEIAPVIGGRRVRTGKTAKAVASVSTASAVTRIGKLRPACRRARRMERRD